MSSKSRAEDMYSRILRVRRAISFRGISGSRWISHMPYISTQKSMYININECIYVYLYMYYVPSPSVENNIYESSFFQYSIYSHWFYNSQNAVSDMKDEPRVYRRCWLMESVWEKESRPSSIRCTVHKIKNEPLKLKYEDWGLKIKD